VERPRVYLAFTLYGHVAPACTLSMLTATADGLESGLVHHVNASVNCFLDRARIELVEKALEAGSSHLMFVDQDVVLPKHALPRLLSLNVPVASGLYFHKLSAMPVAFTLGPEGQPRARVQDLRELPPLSVIGTAPPSIPCPCGVQGDHVHPVAGTGLGCVVIHTGVFRLMVEKFGDRRWFRSSEVGEDVHFAQRCRSLGIPIVLDGHVACGHVTDKVVTQADYLAELAVRHAEVTIS
jgi:hypothetical protein